MYQYNLIFYILKSFLFSIPLWVLIVLFSFKIIYDKHLKMYEKQMEHDQVKS